MQSTEDSSERIRIEFLALFYFILLSSRLPIVYNTSAYDSEESIHLLKDLVDIYMPDFKFWRPDTSQRYCKARDYPEVAKRSIKLMHQQVGDLVFDPNGLAKRGVILRHLVMPGMINESKSIVRFVAFCVVINFLFT